MVKSGKKNQLHHSTATLFFKAKYCQKQSKYALDLGFSTFWLFLIIFGTCYTFKFCFCDTKFCCFFQVFWPGISIRQSSATIQPFLLGYFLWLFIMFFSTQVEWMCHFAKKDVADQHQMRVQQGKCRVSHIEMDVTKWL